MIETFLAVMKYRNITAAAQKLYVSQSTVSHRLQLLEEETGLQLFVRHKGHRMVDMTAEGDGFVPIAHRWMSLFRDTEQMREQASRASLSLGCVDLINSCTFVPLYRELLKEKPQLRLNIRTYHSGEIYALLEDRTIDIGYVYSQRRYPDILAEPVFSDPMVLLCHKDSGYRDGISPQELPAEKEIYLRWASDYEIWHDRYWKRERSLAAVGTGSQLLWYLDEPGRWAIAPASVYHSAGRPEAISCLALSSPPPPRVCCQVTHRYPRASKAALIAEFAARVRAFVEDSGCVRAAGRRQPPSEKHL